MSRRKFFICVLFIFICGSLWAAGRKENISKRAEDPSGFTDNIDISERKPGKYNFYIEAKDRAGNTTLAGPDNIYIDPESDLPRTTIINPLPMMSVQGNMNIVGIAFDDDGVKQVEIAVRRGTDGKGEEITRVTANGTDYWSYFLDTSDGEIWTDGDYTVQAWATDINDLSGIADRYPSGQKIPAKKKKMATVFWRLDRKKPEIIITSHAVGALVSGNIRLNGTVADGNGIAAFSYSIDGGEKYIDSKFSVNKNKKNSGSAWEINLPTKQFEDGPVVIWFKAKDGNNSVGTAAHLLFINNVGPDVKIIYPEPNATVNGVFNIAGYAKHPVGLKSITWKAGNQQGEIELLAGNHWWSAPVDVRAFKGGNSVDVEVKAVDVSGNATIARQKYKFDPVSDLPVVKLTLPITGVLNNDLGLVVKGSVTDDDGVASVFYSLNGAPSKEIPCNGDFQFIIPNPNEGTHSLDVWAKDVNGVTGNKTQVKGIVVSGSSIVPGIASVTYPEGRTNKTETYYTGMKIKPVQRMTMLLSYRAQTAPATSTVSFGDTLKTQVKLTGTKDVFTAAVPVPVNLPEGFLDIKLDATDRQGREFSVTEVVYIVGPSDDDLPATFKFAKHTLSPDGRILLKTGDNLIGVSSKPVRSAALQGAGTNLLNVRVDPQFERQILITATDDGEVGPFSIRIDVEDGTSFTTSQYRVSAISTGPVVTLQNFTEYSWVRTSVNIGFNLTSRNRVAALEYSVDMGETWQRILNATEIAALRAPVNTNITRAIDLTNANDGSISILIKASGDSDYSITEFSVLKDTKTPQVTTIMPIADAAVNGTIRMAFKVEEMGVIQSIAYRRNASAAPREVFNDSQWDGDYAPRFFEILMDSLQMPLDTNMRFTFTDKAGNSETVGTWAFKIDQPMDIPQVQIILPTEDEVVTNDFIVSGVMFDDDGVKQFQWRIDNKPWITEEAEYGFSIPVALSTLTDNEHTVTVIAEDIYGVRSEPTTRKFRVSLTEPTATMTYPLYDTVLKEGVELRGSSFDRNGIKEIKVSIDNGNTFNQTKGTFGTAAETVQWNYQFNTTILKDGPHVVFIRVWDRYEIPATYAFMINVDNTQPEIILDSPGDGSISVGNISVMGRVLDPNLREVSIELRSLDGVTIPANLRSRKLDLSSMIKENIDIAAMADGQYNVAIIAIDRAGNMTRLSRNVQMARQTYRNYIEILYPLESEETSGEFFMYGYAGGSSPAGTVTIRINGADSQTAPVDDSGYFAFKLNEEFLSNGNNAITIVSNFGGPTLISSRAYNLVYRDGGPWVTIDSFKFAEFSYDRAYLSGRTGYVLSPEDKELLADKKTEKEVRSAILAKTPLITEISFDNGRSFQKTNKALAKGVDYRFRLEDGEMAEGYHYIVIRTTMKNGEVAVTRMIVQIDKTNPVIRLISPEAGSRYNQSIAYSASATDDIELTTLSYHLRIGDKAGYEVPGFLQGLYFEGIIPPFLRQIAVENDFSDWVPSFPFAGGATYTDFGIGLSFFDDNVKVQFQYGFMSQDLYESLGGAPPPPGIRYGGDVIAIKLLASVYSLPFGSIWGPDFDWLYGTIAIGANFSCFDISGEGLTPSKEPTWMSALLLQVEFPRVKIPKKKYLRTFSLFTEAQLWFVPTDVPASQFDIPVVIPHIIMGLRLYIF
jgi:hypothetical protein